MSEEDLYFMRRALELARRGMGHTSPNPMVGCVLVRDGAILGEGWHARCGGDHAEVAALKDAARRGESPRGATAYVTLEPCSHFGRTPPCARRLIDEGLSRVVAAVQDPNPLVRGGGLRALREAGIDVTVPCLEEEARWLNRGFFRAQTLGRPWVSLKAAAGLDGRMALSGGESQWITGLEARTQAHRMRAENDGVLVGVGTVLRDDPALTVRHVEGRNPRRVILDSRLRTPPGARAVAGEGGCLILTCSGDAGARKRLEDAGAKVALLPSRDGRVDLEAALGFLAREEGILTLMVEGGPRVLTAFMRAGAADTLSLALAPKVLGEGPGLGTGLFPGSMVEAVELRDLRAHPLGNDLWIEARFSCSPDL